MAEFQAVKDESELDLGEDVESFDIDIAPQGEGGLHIKNSKKQPFQRDTVHQERGAVDIKCSLVDVVHGLWSPHDDDYPYGSLIVLQFRFDPGKRAAHISYAKISVRFFGWDADDEHPGVAKVSLDGSYILVPTKHQEKITSSAEVNAGVNGVPHVDLGTTLKWEKTTDKTRKDATRVSGATCIVDVDTDPANCAEWKLFENESFKSGIPTAIQVGILLKRDSDADFKCTVDIESDVNFSAKVGRWLGGRDIDDPVLFSPTKKKPTNKLMVYDKWRNNLSSFDLKLVEDVTFKTILKGTVKKAILGGLSS